MLRYLTDSLSSCRCWWLRFGQYLWHRLFSASSFYESIRMLIGLACGLGITPYHVARAGEPNQLVIVETWYGFVNAISRWLLFAYCYASINLRNESLIGYFMNNKISEFTTRAHDVGGICATIVVFILPLFLRRHFRHSLELIVRIDRRFIDLKCPMNYNKILGIAWLVLMCVATLDTFITVSCLVCLAKMEVRATWQLTFLMIYELVAISISICLFCLITRSVQTRLAQLHRVRWQVLSLSWLQFAFVPKRIRLLRILVVMSTALRRVRKYFISSQVYEALRPLFFLTFLYGLTPFHVVRRKMGESYLKMSCFGVFNIFIYIFLCGFCYISSLRQGESIVGYFFRTEISTIGDRLQIFNGLIAGAVIYTSAILKRCKLLGTLTILHSLDTNFSNIGVRVKYSRIFRYSILVLIFKLLILGVYFVGVFRLLVSLDVTPSFCVCMTFFLQHSVVSIAICLFCVIAFSFERRLSIINQVWINEIYLLKGNMYFDLVLTPCGKAVNQV